MYIKYIYINFAQLVICHEVGTFTLIYLSFFDCWNLNSILSFLFLLRCYVNSSCLDDVFPLSYTHAV